MCLVEWMECGRIWALAAELCLSHLRDVSATKAKCVHNTLLCANLAKKVTMSRLYFTMICTVCLYVTCKYQKKIPLQVYAVDASEEAAAWARHNVRRYNLESRLHVSPCCILEFLRGTWKLEFRRYRKN